MHYWFFELNTQLYNILIFKRKNFKSKYSIYHPTYTYFVKIDSGHYYTYIYERTSKKWFKYSDINVSEEKEETVLKYAYGHGNSSAYCLMYLNESVV